MAATSLPPSVDGPVQGLLELSLGAVVFLRPEEQQEHLQVRVRWWGSSHSGCTVPATGGLLRFAVRCGPSRLQRYLQDMDSLAISLEPFPGQHKPQVLGTAELDMMGLDAGHALSASAILIATANDAVLGSIPIEASLAFDQSESAVHAGALQQVGHGLPNAKISDHARDPAPFQQIHSALAREVKVSAEVLDVDALLARCSIDAPSAIELSYHRMMLGNVPEGATAAREVLETAIRECAASEEAAQELWKGPPHPPAAKLAAALLSRQPAIDSFLKDGAMLQWDDTLCLADVGKAVISAVPDATLAELRHLLACLQSMYGHFLHAAELWSFLTYLSSSVASGPLPDQAGPASGKCLPTASPAWLSAGKVLQDVQQSAQATPVRPQKQAKRSRSPLIATQTLEKNSAPPRSPDGGPPIPKSPLRRVPQPRAAAPPGRKGGPVQEQPRPVRMLARAVPPEHAATALQPRTKIPRPRSPLRAGKEGRPDRKRSRSPVSRARADRAAAAGDTEDDREAAANEPVATRALGNDTSFWPGGLYDWPSQPASDRFGPAQPAQPKTTPVACLEATRQERDDPSLDTHLRVPPAVPQQQRQGSGISSQEFPGASGNPFSSQVSQQQPHVAGGTPPAVAGNPFGAPFVGQRFPGVPFVPLAPMGVPAPEEGGPTRALELAVGYPQIPASQDARGGERRAQEAQLWHAHDVASGDNALPLAWAAGRDSNASMLVLQSLLLRAEELHIDMHHALQAHGQLRLEQRLAVPAKKRDAGTSPSLDLGVPLSSLAARSCSGKENMGTGGSLPEGGSADCDRRLSAGNFPSRPLAAPQGAAVSASPLPVASEGSEDEDEEALLAEVLMASSAYVNPQAKSGHSQQVEATASQPDGKAVCPSAFPQPHSQPLARSETGTSAQASLHELLPESATAVAQANTPVNMHSQAAVAVEPLRGGSSIGHSWSGWPGSESMEADKEPGFTAAASAGKAISLVAREKEGGQIVLKELAEGESRECLDSPDARLDMASVQGPQTELPQVEGAAADCTGADRLSSDSCETVKVPLTASRAEALPVNEQFDQQPSAPTAAPKPDVLHTLEVSIISAMGLHVGEEGAGQKPHACYLAYRFPGEPAPLRSQSLDCGTSGEITFGVRVQHEVVLPGEEALHEGNDSSEELRFEVWQEWAEGPDTLLAAAVLPLSAIAALPRSTRPADTAASTSQHSCRLALEPMWRWPSDGRGPYGFSEEGSQERGDGEQQVLRSAWGEGCYPDEAALLLDVRYTVAPIAAAAVEETGALHSTGPSGRLLEGSVDSNLEPKSAELQVQIQQACGLGTAVREAAANLDSGSGLLARALQRGPNVFAQITLPTALCRGESAQATVASPIVPSSFSAALQLDSKLRLVLDAATTKALASEEVVISLWHRCGTASSQSSSANAQAEALDIFLGSATAQLSCLLNKPQGLRECLPLHSRQGKPAGAVQMAAFFTEIAGEPYHASPASRAPLDLLPSLGAGLSRSQHLCMDGFGRQPAALSVKLGACGLPEGAEPGLGGARYRVAYRLPGSNAHIETESRTAVQQGGRGNARTPGWRLELQHSHTVWARADTLLAQALLGYPLLLTVLRSSSARSAARKGDTQRSAAVATASVDLSPLLKQPQNGSSDVRRVSLKALVVQPGAKYLSGATASITVVLDLRASAPASLSSIGPQWHKQRIEPAIQEQASEVSGGNPLGQEGGGAGQGDGPTQEEGLSLATELRSLGYTPAAYAASSGNQQPASGSKAREAHSQSGPTVNPGENEHQNVAGMTPPAESGDVGLDGKPAEPRVVGASDAPEQNQHCLRVCIDSALHLKCSTPRSDTQQGFLYVSYTWSAIGAHMSPLAPAARTPESGEVAALWRYTCEHPCKEDAAATGAIAFKVCNRWVAGSAADTETETTPDAGDAVVGVATVDVGPLARLGEIRGWYNVLDEGGRTAGQLKVAVSLPGRLQDLPSRAPAWLPASQPSPLASASAASRAEVETGSSVRPLPVAVDSERRPEEHMPGWRAAGILKQRDSNSTIDLKAALRSNLQELDAIMTHIRPPLPPGSTDSPGAAVGLPSPSASTAVVDSFAGLSLDQQARACGLELPSHTEEGEMRVAEPGPSGACADTDRWDSIEQELWVDPGILSIIGDPHLVPLMAESRMYSVEQAGQSRPHTAEGRYLEFDESIEDQQAGSAADEARERRCATDDQRAGVLPAVSGALDDGFASEAALHDESAAEHGFRSLTGYSSFDEYAFGIGAPGSSFDDASAAWSVAAQDSREAGVLSHTQAQQASDIRSGAEPGIGSPQKGTSQGMGQLLTCSDDENYVVVDALAGDSSSNSGSEEYGFTGQVAPEEPTPLRGFDASALSFGEHTDSAWLFDFTRPSSALEDAPPTAQLDASALRIENPAAISAAQSKGQAEERGRQAEAPPGRQHEASESAAAQGLQSERDTGAGLQGSSKGTLAGSSAPNDEDEALLGALHPLLAVQPVLAPESVASEPELLPPDAPLAVPDFGRPHPLLTFDPFGATSSDIFTPSAQQHSQLSLQTFGPPEFAAELDFLVPVPSERPMTSPARGRFGRRKRLPSRLSSVVSRSAEDLGMPRRSTPPLPPSSRSVMDLSELGPRRNSPSLDYAAAGRVAKAFEQALPGGQAAVQASPGDKAVGASQPATVECLPDDAAQLREAAVSGARQLPATKSAESGAREEEPGTGGNWDVAAHAGALEEVEAAPVDSGQSHKERIDAIDDEERSWGFAERRAESWPLANPRGSLAVRVPDTIVVGRGGDLPLVSPFEASLGSSESPWANSLLGPMHIVPQSFQSSHGSGQIASSPEDSAELPAVLSSEGGFRMSPEVSGNARLSLQLSSCSTAKSAPAALPAVHAEPGSGGASASENSVAESNPPPGQAPQGSSDTAARGQAASSESAALLASAPLARSAEESAAATLSTASNAAEAGAVLLPAAEADAATVEIGDEQAHDAEIREKQNGRLISEADGKQLQDTVEESCDEAAESAGGSGRSLQGKGSALPTGSAQDESDRCQQRRTAAASLTEDSDLRHLNWDPENQGGWTSPKRQPVLPELGASPIPAQHSGPRLQTSVWPCVSEQALPSRAAEDPKSCQCPQPGSAIGAPSGREPARPIGTLTTAGTLMATSHATAMPGRVAHDAIGGAQRLGGAFSRLYWQAELASWGGPALQNGGTIGRGGMSSIPFGGEAALQYEQRSAISEALWQQQRTRADLGLQMPHVHHPEAGFEALEMLCSDQQHLTGLRFEDESAVGWARPRRRPQPRRRHLGGAELLPGNENEMAPQPDAA